MVRRGFLCRVVGTLDQLHGVECRECDGRGYQSVYERGEYGPNRYQETCSTCHGTGRTPGLLRDLLRREPLTPGGIVVSDRGPYWNGYGHSWFNTDRPSPSSGVPDSAQVPADVFAVLEELGRYERIAPSAFHQRFVSYPTADSARLALGVALYDLHTRAEVSR